MRKGAPPEHDALPTMRPARPAPGDSREAGATGRGARADVQERAGSGAMALSSFFPYRLAVLAETVSRSIARVYAERFDLSRDEWRVLAALGESGAMKTQAALLFTTLDKVQVSRAVARLEHRRLVEREADPSDRRNRILRLTAAGRSLYRRIVPLVRAREDYLLATLADAERRALDRAIDGLLARARELEQQR